MQLPLNGFTEKELYTKVQMFVENQLNTNANYVHPYCLSLDTIANAMHALVTNHCLVKQSAFINNKTVITFKSNPNELNEFGKHLQRYCVGLKQFNGLSTYLLISKM